MIRTTKGIKGRWMRKLYGGVVIPKMLYTADVWCTDLISKGRGKLGGRGARGFASQMARVHRMATILITGAMRSTASDLLDAHANVPPFQQILRSHCHRATLRLATLNSDHPLHKGVASAHQYVAKHDFTKQKRLPSLIHKLFCEFKIDPNTTKTILPICHYPMWTPDIEAQIAESKEKSLEEDTRAGEELRVYSDGLIIDGGVGGATVMMEGERRIRESRFHLGKEEEHTVYEGKIVGMILAVKLLKDEMRARGGRTMAVGADNQAAVRATNAFQSKPGHYLMDKFHDDLRTLFPTEDDGKLVIRWSAGHIGIPGNEQADEQAKRAARGETTDPHLLPNSLRSPNNEPATLPASKSAIKQMFNTSINEEAKTVLCNSPRSDKFREIDPSYPSNRFRKLADGYPRKHAALLIQLRTGHIPLNKHLHRISRAPSPICPACEEREESVHHFLLSCPAHARQRAIMKAEIRTRAHNLKDLLNEGKRQSSNS